MFEVVVVARRIHVRALAPTIPRELPRHHRWILGPPSTPRRVARSTVIARATIKVPDTILSHITTPLLSQDAISHRGRVRHAISYQRH